MSSILPPRVRKRIAGAASRLRRYAGEGWRAVGAIERVAGRHHPVEAIPLRDLRDRHAPGQVDQYWTRHTVNSTPFRAAAESRRYLERRFDEHPRFREMMELYGDHRDGVILDYGCGPGDDVVGFTLHSRAKRIIGMDVSPRALGLTRARLALHGEALGRAELIQTADDATRVPLPDASVDYLHSGGVLHHASDPEGVLRELHRVVKPGGRGCVMVYNQHSVWLHLYTAYTCQIVEGKFAGQSALDAFTHNVDGEDCPLARCYTPDEFLAICRRAGFEAEFVGGYLSRTELDALADRNAAIAHPALAPAHRAFLEELRVDADGLPTYRGFHAGVGGVFRLRRP